MNIGFAPEAAVPASAARRCLNAEMPPTSNGLRRNQVASGDCQFGAHALRRFGN
jgi:hypothetical protein